MKTRIPSKYVIQANKLENIIDMLESIAGGPKTDSEIASTLEIDKRQGTYHRMAAEAIGLIEYENEKAELTRLGLILVNMLVDSPDRISFLRVIVMINPLLRRIVDDLEIAGRDGLEVGEIEQLVIEYSGLGEETASRRTESIVKWLEFLKLAKPKGDSIILDIPLFALKSKE